MRLTKFTAGLLALSLAAAGLAAAPARAANEDLLKALGGLAAIVVIGKAIDNNRDKSKEKHKDRKPAGRHAEYLIPRECVTSATADDRRGGYRDRSRLVVTERCATRARASRTPLPRACETRLPTRQGRVDAYDLGCLTNFGYRVDEPVRFGAPSYNKKH
ncbi:hypothetical protein [Celeribacter indicus]|uniref:Uncharacterized protein n=1 Tax=Celeribacter indicus TaxID=1208324 RepID=A0A0B5DNB9_9RHOB|nr:hypothetical protein [Celeribacter indicus]AJE45098.1 hypothetical protein P73_0383 [Celeribacter indicus]SDX27520.1 hypothetical protein SAMN05443573_11985 [Celeribacter indicus]